MSQQINLYDAALERQRELLTAVNVALAGAALLLVVGAWGGWARVRAANLESEAAGVASHLKTLQDQSAALTAELATRKPDPRLADELAAARIEAENRQAVLAILHKGLGPEATSFAEYLRGLARQNTGGLWLTGFSVDADTNGMEIRGRTLDPSSLPNYIQRLNNEKVFQGRSFAALQMKMVSAEPATAPGQAAAAAPALAPVQAAQPAATSPAATYSEFTLVPAKPAAPPVEKRP